MISNRGKQAIVGTKLPWRFPPTTNIYDEETNPNGIISFALAENVPMHQYLSDWVNKTVTIPKEAYTYAYSRLSTSPLRPAITSFMNKYFDPLHSICPSDVLISASCTALHEILGFSLADPGQGILVNRPIYGRFELDFGNKMDLKIVYADVGNEEAFGESVVERYEEAVEKAGREGVVVRALMLVNPNNPTGRCYPRDTLDAIIRMCDRLQIHLICDEIYALSVFDSGEADAVHFTSALSLESGYDLFSKGLLHVEYGMAKDFAAAGLKIGYLITTNEEVKQSANAIMRFHTPSGPSIAISTAILQDERFLDSFLSKARQSLAHQFRYTTTILTQHGIPYLRGGNAGFFVFVNLSSYLPPSSPTTSSSSSSDEQNENQHREFALAQKLVEGGVFLHPGEEHSLHPGWFRVVYSTEQKVLGVGLKRLVGILGEIEKVQR